MSNHRRPTVRSVPRLVIFTVLFALCMSFAVAITGSASADRGERGGQDQQTHQQRGDRRETNHRRGDNNQPPVQQAPPAQQMNNCSLRVPAHPLTAQGLATPYVLQNCSEANGDQGAFVEATIVDPAGALSVYRPLVVTQGTQPAAPPTVPVLPAGSTVALWFGFQGDNLRLVGPGARGCVNGLRNSLFGQFAYCNAPNFFEAAAAAGVQAPPLKTAFDGQPCPTVRDFLVVDQDQSDNVTTEYLLNADGTTAQNTAANRALLPQATVLLNASDNGLLNRKINPALGCMNFTTEDLTDPAPNQVASLALNEIQAMQQAAPVALVPVNDPMTLVNGNFSPRKTALYRLGVGQPITMSLNNPQQNALNYCNNLVNTGLPRLQADAALFAAVASPDAAFPNLDAFLLDRFQASLVELKCPQASTAQTTTTAPMTSMGN